MALLALLILKRCIGDLPILFPFVCSSKKVNKHILYAVPGFCIEKIERVMGRRQMTIHTVGHKPLCIVHMRGRFPGIIRRLNLMARGAKLGGRSPNHGVVEYTEQWERDHNAGADKDSPDEVFFQSRTFC